MADQATDSTTDQGADQTSVDTSTTDATDQSATDAGATDQGQAALGDAGKKALDAMKAKWKAAEQAAKERDTQIAELQAKINGTEADHARAREAQRVKDEALAAANARILKAEVRAAAAGKLNDPADALAYVDLTSFEVAEDGAVDSDAIGAAIADLISKKPYLAAQGGRFQGSADGGARNDVSTVSQLTRADMARMTPEQIEDARTAGRFDDLLNGK